MYPFCYLFGKPIKSCNYSKALWGSCVQKTDLTHWVLLLSVDVWTVVNTVLVYKWCHSTSSCVTLVSWEVGIIVLCISEDMLNAALIILHSIILQCIYTHPHHGIYSYIHPPRRSVISNCTIDSNPAFTFHTHACALQVFHFRSQSKSCYPQDYCLSFLGFKDLLLGCLPLTIKYQMFSHE